MIKHISECIVQRKEGLDLERLEFSNVADYIKWEENMQLETHSYFSKHRGDYESKNKDLVTIYKYCQFNQEIKSHAKTGKIQRKTDRKLKRGPIPHLNCSAKIVARVSESAVTVDFFHRHSHPQSTKNLQYQPLPHSVVWTVKMMISQGLDCRKIIKNLDDGKWHRVHRGSNNSEITYDKKDGLTHR
jgi:hypothetical protein